jgi:hypothetical protein
LNVGDRNDEDDDDRHPMEREEEEVNGNTGTVELDSDEDEAYEEDETVTVGGTIYRVREVKRQKTREEDKDSDDEDGNIIKMGETVTAGEYIWKRIEGITEDVRKEHDDMESIFWLLVCTIIGQIDSRPVNEREREGEEENPTQHCKHVPIGQYRVTSGTHKGAIKSKQARCKYCHERK